MTKYFVLSGNRKESEMKNTRPPIDMRLIVVGVAGWAVAIGLAIADISGG